MLRWGHTSRIASQHADYEQLIVITALLHEYLVLLDLTTPISELSLHFDLSYTPGRFLAASLMVVALLG